MYMYIYLKKEKNKQKFLKNPKKPHIHKKKKHQTNKQPFINQVMHLSI